MNNRDTKERLWDFIDNLNNQLGNPVLVSSDNRDDDDLLHIQYCGTKAQLKAVLEFIAKVERGEHE